MEALLQLRRLRHTVRLQTSSSRTESPSDGSSEELKVVTGDTIHVEFEENDPHDPRYWAARWKALYISIIWLMVFVTGWASSANATSHEISAINFHVSMVAESLATSIFLFGVAFGALLAGPCSESFGRLPVYLLTFLAYLVWVMASALAPNFGAQVVFRLLAGFFASATMSIYGGSLADLLDVDTRAKVWPFFALSPLLGPSIAPIASGWITQDLGPRWVDWITLIISGFTFVLALLFLPETSAPIILSYKASMLRRATGEARYQSEYDGQEGLLQILKDNLIRIAHFISTESTTVLFGIYATVLYALIFGFLEGFDYIFSRTYGFSIGQRYSAFAAITIGILLGLPYILIMHRFNTRVVKDIRPEHRLRPSLFAAPLLPISLFWIGWTNRPDISAWSALGACVLFGFALMSLFTPTYHYILDAYGTKASSALAAITFARYLVSGAMVLATEPLYRALTVKWMLTLLGCIAALLAPVPLAFWVYGSRIRRRSDWAKHDD